VKKLIPLFLIFVFCSNNATSPEPNIDEPTSTSTSTIQITTTTTTTIPSEDIFEIERVDVKLSTLNYEFTGNIGKVSVNLLFDGSHFRGYLNKEKVDINFYKTSSSKYIFEGTIGDSDVDVSFLYCPECLVRVSLFDFTGKIASTNNINANANFCFDCFLKLNGPEIEGSFGGKVYIDIDDYNSSQLQFSGQGNLASIIGIFGATVIHAGY
tara:strand:+ start:535 stop:1167 length:633 start_codon:yes stop_codon:yes gene_type:complete